MIANQPFRLFVSKSGQSQIVLSERIRQAVDSDVVDSKDDAELYLLFLIDGFCCIVTESATRDIKLKPGRWHRLPKNKYFTLQL
jgi:hypothetical protein